MQHKSAAFFDRLGTPNIRPLGLRLLLLAIVTGNWIFLSAGQTCSSPVNQRFGSLLDNSPFGASPQNTDAVALPLELRGICAEGEKWLFAIYEISKSKSSWIELGVQENGFYISKYHPNDETVTLKYAGRTYSLKLKKALIAQATETDDSPLHNPENVGLGGGDHPETVKTLDEP
jgi:hypothetical protein